MKATFAVLLLSAVLLGCDSQGDTEDYLGEGHFLLDGKRYDVNNAHFFTENAGNYLIISLSRGQNAGWVGFTKGTRQHVRLVLSAGGDAASLPAGTYTFPMVGSAPGQWRIVAGALDTIPYGDEDGEEYKDLAYADQDNDFYADFFDEQLTGKVTLSGGGTDYQIDFDMPQLRRGGSLSGSYRGAIAKALPDPDESYD